MEDCEWLICPHQNCGKQNRAEDKVCENCGRPFGIYSQLFFLPTYLYNEGLKAYKAGNIEEAVGCLLLSKELNPKEPDTFILLGKIYARLNRLETAVDIWLDALDIQPENEPALRCLSEAQKIIDSNKQDKDSTNHE